MHKGLTDVARTCYKRGLPEPTISPLQIVGLAPFRAWFCAANYVITTTFSTNTSGIQSQHSVSISISRILSWASVNFPAVSLGFSQHSHCKPRSWSANASEHAPYSACATKQFQPILQSVRMSTSVLANLSINLPMYPTPLQKVLLFTFVIISVASIDFALLKLTCGS